MTTQPAYRKKLIEVDLPLDEINKACEDESPGRSGHPSILHKWWARRPLTACRAVVFASMVDDPSHCPEKFTDEEAQTQERERLHDIIKKLLKWETTDENRPETRDILNDARYEIARSVARSVGEAVPDRNKPSDVLSYLNRKAPPIYDLFSGGGSIPLEAQRLGLRAVASDLNPVAVLINKALIELPLKFANQPPVNADADPMGMMVGKGSKKQRMPWRGAAGLTDDIRYYGRWMQEKTLERIGHLYPKAKLPDGSEATVIAWLWARTIPCPNPACGFEMPLIKSFQLSKKRGNEHWIRPIVDRGSKTISFKVQDHDTNVPTVETGGGGGSTCLACLSSAPTSYVREQGKRGNMGEQMTAIVAQGSRRRKLFLTPTREHARAAEIAEPRWRPIGKLPERALGFRVQAYGFTEWHQLFTKRQLTATTTFIDLLSEVRDAIIQDGATEEYANSVCTYLAFVCDKKIHSGSSFCRWRNDSQNYEAVFSRQALPMVWDFAEANSVSISSKEWMGQFDSIASVVERLPVGIKVGEVFYADAAKTTYAKHGSVIVTDPPYYDNIAYADLSDFFYVWLRPILRDIYPDLFAGISTPKDEEMIAEPTRFESPRERFEGLLRKTLGLLRKHCSTEFPSSIFYAYRQQEEEREGTTSTGWETMLTAIVASGFEIVGTWPMRTEMSSRQRSLGSNALASSVVLVCRPRPDDAPVATRRQFLDELSRELPDALDQLTRDGHIAPVDLAQAAIGPGMQVYSRFSRVETIGGEPVTVRDALVAINFAIAEYDARQEGDFDSETRFCLAWLQEHGFTDGAYGEANTLAQAKNTSVDGMSGLLTAERGSVRLLPIASYSPGRQPLLGEMTAWEGCFRMAYHFSRREDGRTVEGATQVARAMSGGVDAVERLARILYNHFDRLDDSANAVAFNSLVIAWGDIIEKAREVEQGGLL